jgi:hypothetical protein
VDFNAAGAVGGIINGESKPGTNYDVPGETIWKLCFPLYSILMALGNPTVDYFSVDLEGAELQVLQSLPLDKVDIK